MWSRLILLVAVSAAVLAVGSCGGKKKDAPGGSKGGTTGSAGTMGPARMTPEVKHIRKSLVLSATQKERHDALEKLVKGWPRTRGALPAALGLLKADKENRGMVAMSLARIGRPLVAALNQMTAKSPRHLPTLRAAGALAYHLVVRAGLIKQTDAEFAARRKALLPTVKRITGVFNVDTRPRYEIYQGVAVGAEVSIARFKLPIVEGGLTRVAMVLYLILSNRPNEAILPKVDRVRLRKMALHLAKPFAVALPHARAFTRGESPDSLMLGLSVLGIDAARAVAAVPDMAKQKGCAIAVKMVNNMLDQVPAQTAAPLRPLIQKCQKLEWKHAPNMPAALKESLAKLDGKAPKPAPRPAPGMAPGMAPKDDHGHDHGHDHMH